MGYGDGGGRNMLWTQVGHDDIESRLMLLFLLVISLQLPIVRFLFNYWIDVLKQLLHIGFVPGFPRT